MLSTIFEKEQRRVQRLELRIPVRVEVSVGRSTAWNEDAITDDISAFGVAVHLQRPVKRGRVLLLSLAMPHQLRLYDIGKPVYRVWGVVQRCIQCSGSGLDRRFSTGIAFIGKEAPPGFADHPSRLYEISPPSSPPQGFWKIVDDASAEHIQDPQKEFRKETRFAIPEDLVIELLDESGDVIALEPTFTENLSVGGAAVFSNFGVEPGTFVRLISETHGVEIISIVRHTREDPEGIFRLHVEFIDRLFPLEGIV
jgi:hypothetical protein